MSVVPWCLGVAAAQRGADAVSVLLALAAFGIVAGACVGRWAFRLVRGGLPVVAAAAAAGAGALGVSWHAFLQGGAQPSSVPLRWFLLSDTLVLSSQSLLALSALYVALLLAFCTSPWGWLPRERGRLAALLWVWSFSCPAFLFRGALSYFFLTAAGAALAGSVFPSFPLAARARRVWSCVALFPSSALFAALLSAAGTPGPDLRTLLLCVWSFALPLPVVAASLAGGVSAGVFLVPVVGGCAASALGGELGGGLPVALSVLSGVIFACAAVVTNDARRCAVYMNWAVLHQFLAPSLIDPSEGRLLCAAFPFVAFAGTVVILRSAERRGSFDTRFGGKLSVARYEKWLLSVLLVLGVGLLAPGGLLAGRLRGLALLWREWPVLGAGAAMGMVVLFLAVFRLLSDIDAAEGSRAAAFPVPLCLLAVGMLAATVVYRPQGGVSWVSAVLTVGPLALAGALAYALRRGEGVARLWSWVDPGFDRAAESFLGPALVARPLGALGRIAYGADRCAERLTVSPGRVLQAAGTVLGRLEEILGRGQRMRGGLL